MCLGTSTRHMAAWRAEERFMSTPLRDDQGCRKLEKNERECFGAKM